MNSPRVSNSTDHLQLIENLTPKCLKRKKKHDNACFSDTVGQLYVVFGINVKPYG